MRNSVQVTSAAVFSRRLVYVGTKGLMDFIVIILRLTAKLNRLIKPWQCIFTFGIETALTVTKDLRPPSSVTGQPSRAVAAPRLAETVGMFFPSFLNTGAWTL